MSDWSPRVMIVGWDGADWRLLRPLAEQGVMPHLAALLSQGVALPLRSTQPPVTAPAWTSFATGMHPGHHGLLSWQYPLDSQFRRPWVDSSAAGRPRLWDRLGQAGLRTGVVGLPLTYPVLPIDGVMISGMLTPGLDSPFIFPAELAGAFRKLLPDYRFDVDIQHVERNTTELAGLAEYLSEVSTALHQRTEAIEFLWLQGPYECVIAVYETPDRLQHLFHQFVAGVPAASRPDWREVQEKVLAVYAALDAALGRLLERIDLDRTTLLMVSDHGFGPLQQDFHLSNWLAENSYATYADGRVQTRHLLARAVKPFKRWIPVAWLRRGRSGFAPYRQLDWGATLAYAGMTTEDGVWINLRGREPMGIVEPGAEYERLRDKIAAQLMAWRDPADGGQPVTGVWKREELFGEPFRDRAPDLILRLRDGCRAVAERGSGQLTTDRSALGEGIHREEGILLIAGSGLRRPSRVTHQPHLVDIVPTVLALVGLPAPEDLDGIVLHEVAAVAVHRPSSATSNPSEATAAGGFESDASTAYSEEEAEMVRRRLAALGYLD